MAHSLKIGVRQLRTSAAELNVGVLRTERDLPLSFVLGGIVVIIALVTFVPGIIGSHTGLVMRFVAALAIAFFAFCFVTVSSRIVGMIGVTSNPTSGMAIVTLLGTGFVFWALGAASSFLTCFLQRSPWEVNRCPLDAADRPPGCPKQGDAACCAPAEAAPRRPG